MTIKHPAMMPRPVSTSEHTATMVVSSDRIVSVDSKSSSGMSLHRKLSSVIRCRKGIRAMTAAHALYGVVSSRK